MSSPYQNDPTMHDPYASNPASSGSPSGYSGYETPAYSASNYDSYAQPQPQASAQDPYQGYESQGYESQGYATYGQQTPYAAPGLQPYQAAMLPDHPQATMVLVLGIIGIVMVWLCAPFAWYFGNKAKKEVDANPGMYKDGGMLTVGRILGIIGTVLLILYSIFFVLYIIFVVVLVASTSSF